MDDVYLIDSEYVKNNTPINNDVDEDLIAPYIIKVQNTHLQSVLGTNLYNKILTDVLNGTLTGVYKTLVDDYILRMVNEWVFYEALPFISIKINNKSIGRGYSEFFTEGDVADLKYLRNTIRDMAEFYSTRLTQYLKENSNEYPEYLNNSGLDKMQPNRKNYFSGIYTGGNRSNGCDFGLGEKYINLF